MALTFTIVDVNGVSRVLDLTTLGIGVAPGATGLGMPGFEIQSDKLPYAPGSAPRRLSTSPTTIDIPLFAERPTAALLEALLDDLHGWVFPGTERSDLPSTIRFQVLASDGTNREIIGVCTGGLDDDDSLDRMGTTWQDLLLSLECDDPYPRDVTATVHTFTANASSVSWFPYWPYNLTSSTVYSQETITNTGQLEVWPVWTITGPGTGVTLANLTTGETLALDANGGLTLVAGDVVTIDTSEGVKTILDANGANLWPFAATTSTMWPLGVGANDIRIEMNGATVASSVSLSYRRRWTRMRRR